MTTPHLTRQRWACLVALRNNPFLMRRAFLASELVIEGRGGRPWSGTGPTLDSLRKAGWVERIAVGGASEGMPFRTGGAAYAWQVTESGRQAVAACPDTFPGEPVYHGKGKP